MHNPTTVTLSPSRRKSIAEIIRKAGTALIEDDAYGALRPFRVADRQPDP
jgi:DNA-binding transcriptional MocR family regulator